MTPDIFGNLQPGEFLQLWGGYQWRKERDEEIEAYFTAAAMSVHAKKEISPKELLKPLRPRVKKQRSKREDEKYLREKFKGLL